MARERETIAQAISLGKRKEFFRIAAQNFDPIGIA